MNRAATDGASLTSCFKYTNASLPGCARMRAAHESSTSSGVLVTTESDVAPTSGRDVWRRKSSGPSREPRTARGVHERFEPAARLPQLARVDEEYPPVPDVNAHSTRRPS